MPTSRRISNFAENQRWGLFFDQINDSREIFSLDRYSGGNNKYQARISQYSYLRAAKNTGNFCRHRFISIGRAEDKHSNQAIQLTSSAKNSSRGHEDFSGPGRGCGYAI